MSSLAAMGLGVYGLIPDFQDSCPLCQGAGCAVRHGLYFRQAVDVGGAVYERFPVPRFLCRRKGPHQPQGRTFSVLPAALAPRRRFSLPLMLWLLSLVLEGGKTVRQALDRLAESCRGAERPSCACPGPPPPAGPAGRPRTAREAASRRIALPLPAARGWPAKPAHTSG